MTRVRSGRMPRSGAAPDRSPVRSRYSRRRRRKSRPTSSPVSASTARRLARRSGAVRRRVISVRRDPPRRRSFRARTSRWASYARGGTARAQRSTGGSTPATCRGRCGSVRAQCAGPRRRSRSSKAIWRAIAERDEAPLAALLDRRPARREHGVTAEITARDHGRLLGTALVRTTSVRASETGMAQSHDARCRSGSNRRGWRLAPQAVPVILHPTFAAHA